MRQFTRRRLGRESSGHLRRSNPSRLDDGLPQVLGRGVHVDAAGQRRVTVSEYALRHGERHAVACEVRTEGKKRGMRYFVGP